ncbi:hypothetical protein HPP92_018018 [Vanilla planifolia]|uniref:ATPase F1/V1/A1 complex alpha/beta subunit N-terminal domain-containing protein n=1 Tax=Vanilla planifolia TaxID=51239 RepID=A0A835QDJ4_VANPL|nr:hypothetical protein HPP92_018018 [Vanilla planifolia]
MGTLRVDEIDERIELEEGTIGIALNLESDNVGVVLMSDGFMIKEGSSIKAIGRITQIPLLGKKPLRILRSNYRVIDWQEVDDDREIILLDGNPSLPIRFDHIPKGRLGKRKDASRKGYAKRESVARSRQEKKRQRQGGKQCRRRKAWK